MVKKGQTVMQTGNLPQPARRDSASPDDRINILLVDDEPKNLTVLESILDDPRFRLIKASSSKGESPLPDDRHSCRKFKEAAFRLSPIAA